MKKQKLKEFKCFKTSITVFYLIFSYPQMNPKAVEDVLKMNVVIGKVTFITLEFTM